MAQLYPFLPVLFVLVGAVLLGFAGTRAEGAQPEMLLGAAVGVLGIAALAVLASPHAPGGSSPIVSDGYGQAWTALVFLSCACVLVIAVSGFESAAFIKRGAVSSVLLIAGALAIMVSARSFWLVYAATEVAFGAFLALVNINANRSWREGPPRSLLVLMLGASGMMVLSLVLMLADGGSTHYDVIATRVQGFASFQVSLLAVFIFGLGLVTKLVGLASHLIRPDQAFVAPLTTICLGLTALAPAVLGVLARATVELVPGQSGALRIALPIMAAGACVWFGVRALREIGFTSFLVALCLAQVAFVLFALSSGSLPSMSGLLQFSVVFAASTIGLFAIAVGLFRSGSVIEELDDLSGLASNRRIYGTVFLLLLAAMAGLPPLTGFLSRLVILQAGFNSGLPYATLFLLTTWSLSVLACLRVMWVVLRPNEGEAIPPIRPELLRLATGALIAIVLLAIFSGPFSEWTNRSVSSLF